MWRWVLVAALLGGGCHARFQSRVDDIRGVRVRVGDVMAPHVRLGIGGTTGSVTEAALGALQVGRSVAHTRTLQRKTSKRAIADALRDRLRDRRTRYRALAPPPNGRPDSSLLVDVLWMRVAESSGARPTEVRMRVRSTLTHDQQRIYRGVTRCRAPFISARRTLYADAGTAIEDARPKELQAWMEGAARACADQVLTRLGAHGRLDGR